ncbi:MAG TPA: LysR family transcriptional regulator [Bacillaceae bacterium]
MDIKKLQHFVAIVEENSFSKAAKTLHISQPSLSQSIKFLERQLGTPLLERSTRHFHVTDSGILLYQRAKELIRRMESIQKELDESITTGRGELHLGIIESTQHWVPKIIKDFKIHNPNMQIRFTEISEKKHVIQSLRNYDVHLSITNQLIKEDDISITPIYRETYMVIMHQQHRLAWKRELNLDDLRGEPLILGKPGYQTRANILEALASRNIKANIMFEIERFETAWNLAEENLGIAFIPENYIYQGQNSQVIRKTIDSPLMTRTVYLAHMKNRFFPAAIKQLIENIPLYFR